MADAASESAPDSEYTVTLTKEERVAVLEAVGFLLNAVGRGEIGPNGGRLAFPQGVDPVALMVKIAKAEGEAIDRLAPKPEVVQTKNGLELR
jgi:hypothetical protein